MKRFTVYLTTALLLAMLPISAKFASANTPDASDRAARVLAKVDDSNLSTLKGNVERWANSKNDLGLVSDSQTIDMFLVLKRSDAQESDLQKMLSQQQNRSSEHYHQWLTPEQYGYSYGIAATDLSAVTNWLAAKGFSVELVAKGSNIVRFSGNSSQIQSAFHSAVHQYKVGTETRYAVASNPQIPAALATVIKGIAGLNEDKPRALHTTPHVVRKNADGSGWSYLDSNGNVLAAGASPAAIGKVKPLFNTTDSSTNYYFVGPGDFATIYGLRTIWNTYDGTGQTIAIVSPSDINKTDVTKFRTAFGLPTAKLNVIYDGANPGVTSSSYEGEADLDVEWSGAIAKNATIDLVVSQSVLGAALYVINNNLAPILSVSYGECELGLGVSGNELLSELWEQAASQGITVLVASGDSGSASCDQNEYYSTYGLSVSGYSSTPYNTSVGGTDFSANFGYASNYWGKSNSSTDLTSALGYIPESPWNESCGSPQILEAALTDSSWAADKTNLELCNDSSAQDYFLNTAGGSGGISNCTNSDGDTASCTAGYPQPSWQSGVTGVLANSRRQLPDVSFFSGSGVWGSAYLYCQSDLSYDGACNYSSVAKDATYNAAGGTSFATPAFAGVVALLNQKTGERQGNINYTMYALASKQFNDSTLNAACQTDGANSPGTSSSCIFHDVAKGNNAVPCYAGTVDNPPAGVCNAPAGESYGVLSGYSAGAGYDMASGLGTLNITNFVNSWPSAGTATTTSLTLPSTTAAYGANLTANITVKTAQGTPTGLVSLLYTLSSGSSASTEGSADLSNGSGTIKASYISVGTYPLYAYYAGDGTYNPSTSSTQSVTISKAATTLSLSANRTSVATGSSVLLTSSVLTASYADYPTGQIVFTNTTTGSTLGSIAVAGYSVSSTQYSDAQATLTVGGSGLVNGANVITATYTGDGSYAASSASSTTVTYSSGFTITSSKTVDIVAAGSTVSDAITLTLTPVAGTSLTAGNISLACPGTLPSGITCKFTTPVQGSNGVVTSTLSFAFGSPLISAMNHVPPSIRRGDKAIPFGMALAGCVALFGIRKRRLAALLLCVCMFGMYGCGGSGSTASTPLAITLTPSSSTPTYQTPLTLTSVLNKGDATGTISFFDGATLLGKSTVSSAAASYSLSSLALGTHSLTATYSGSSQYALLSSAPVSVDVNLSSNITVRATDTSSGSIAQSTINLTIQ